MWVPTTVSSVITPNPAAGQYYIGVYNQNTSVSFTNATYHSRLAPPVPMTVPYSASGQTVAAYVITLHFH